MSKLVHHQKDFPWGIIEATHVIEYLEVVIIEYFSIINWGHKPHKYSDVTSFKPYFEMGKKDLSQSFGTFEEALIQAIAVKYDGINTQACGFFWKAIQPWGSKK